MVSGPLFIESIKSASSSVSSLKKIISSSINNRQLTFPRFQFDKFGAMLYPTRIDNLINYLRRLK